MRPARRSRGGGAAAAASVAGPRRAGLRQEEAPPSRRRRPWAGSRGPAMARTRAGLRRADKAAVVGLLPATGPRLGPLPAPSAAARPGQGMGSGPGPAEMAPESALPGDRRVPARSGLGAEAPDPGRTEGGLSPTSGGCLFPSPVPPFQGGVGHARGGLGGLWPKHILPLSLGLDLGVDKGTSPARAELPVRDTQAQLCAQAGGYGIHINKP